MIAQQRPHSAYSPCIIVALLMTLHMHYNKINALPLGAYIYRKSKASNDGQHLHVYISCTSGL